MAKDDTELKLDDRAVVDALEALRRDAEALDPAGRAIVARILRHVDEARAGLTELAEHLAG